MAERRCEAMNAGDHKRAARQGQLRAFVSVALSASLGLTPAASADEGAYFGVGWFQWNYDEDGVPEATASTARFALGRQLNDHLSIEGQFATGGSDTVPVFVPGFGTAEVDVELDQAFSLLLRPHTSGGDFRVFGLFGFTTGEITVTSGDFSTSADDSGLSYGVGAEVALGPGTWFGIDYVNYLRDDFYTVDALSAGVRFEF